MRADILFGLDTFGDDTQALDGTPVSQAQTIRDVVAQAKYADELGLYGFGIGEHHRSDFAISAPDTVLAGIATVTNQIKVGTAVTILSTDDPVRVYERFATLQALSNGRAEISVGRGSYLESFKLFGYSPDESFELFDERLELFGKLLRETEVTWQGKTRAPLKDQQVWPKTDTPLGFRIAVGGSPESSARAAKMGAQLALSVISGDPTRFEQYIADYRYAMQAHGHQPQPVSVHGPGFIGATDAEAIEEYWGYYDASYGVISRERGQSHITEDYYLSEIAGGALYVGSAETVAKKMARTVAALKVDRFDFKYSAGYMPHERAMANIAAYATEVAPRVRELLARG